MRFFAASFAVLGLITWLGCEPQSGNNAKSNPVAKEVEESHDHEHGPHGSVAFLLDGSDFKVEALTSKSNNLVQVFILDKAATSNHPLKPIKADKVVIRTDKLGGKSFDLAAVNPDANGLAAEYSLDSQELKSITSLHPTLEITIGDKKFSGELELH